MKLYFHILSNSVQINDQGASFNLKDGLVHVIWNVTGKPKPTVTCRIEIDKDSLIIATSQEISSYKFTNNASLPVTFEQLCETKTLVCTARGYGKPISTNHSVLNPNCKSSFIHPIEFARSLYKFA